MVSMDSMPPPMLGTGLDVELEYGLPQIHEAFTERLEEEREKKQLHKLEVESTLLAELQGKSGEIVRHIIEATMRDLNDLLLGNHPDTDLIFLVRQVRHNLDLLSSSLGLTSLFENSTKHVILSFVMDTLRVSLPQHQGYQTPFTQPKAASDNGTPAE
jgi:hypothetical protein